MTKLTKEQRDMISFVLELIFTRPELLVYMREQLKNNFWAEIEKYENE